ncbi:MAG: ABC transporter ATP-binding protein [Oscillospiraceae bacterium]|nr:ABC transporter ATP-binding protein [Oscillospiraceae bacterium]
MKKLKDNLKVLWWSIRIAFRISPNVFLFWLIFSGAVALLPSVALICNRNAVSILTEYLLSGQGCFSDIIPPLCTLGLILILAGFSRRINGDFLYAVMYDDFYFGMQEYLMDSIQKVEIKTLLDKSFYDDYCYCVNRSGSLTDLMSSGCICIMKSISAISLIGVAISVSLPIGIIAAACFVISMVLNLRFSSRLVVDTLDLRAIEAESKHYSDEMKKPGVAKEMRIYQTQGFFLSKWKQAFGKVQDYWRNYDQSGVKLSSCVSMCLYASILLMLLFSVLQSANGTQSVDVFLMLYLLGESLSETNKVFSSSVFEALRGFQALRYQHRFLTNVPMHEERRLDKDAIEETTAQQQNVSRVVFEGKDLRFSYDGKHEVLHGLNFQIREGETIALVGSNGSGKSTLVKLLVDLYRPDSGDLLFYGKRYRDYPIGSINQKIGMFFQNFYLFHMSLRENVGFGNIKHLKDDDVILAAMEKGGAIPIAEKAPKGLEQILKKTVIKDGMNLSGGEQQKVAVSRTHMTDKDILIFDEPAAALDPIAEMEQFQNIKAKAAGRTAILISHRVGFARMADRIFVLNKGDLVEVGTHEELLRKNGVYADFFHQQAQWYET